MATMIKPDSLKQPIPPPGGILKMAVELTALRLLTQAILGLNYGHHDKAGLNGSKMTKACSAATGLTSECQDTDYRPERQGDFRRRFVPTIETHLDVFGNPPSNPWAFLTHRCHTPQIPIQS